MKSATLSNRISLAEPRNAIAKEENITKNPLHLDLRGFSHAESFLIVP